MLFHYCRNPPSKKSDKEEDEVFFGPVTIKEKKAHKRADKGLTVKQLRSELKGMKNIHKMKKHALQNMYLNRFGKSACPPSPFKKRVAGTMFKSKTVRKEGEGLSRRRENNKCPFKNSSATPSRRNAPRRIRKLPLVFRVPLGFQEIPIQVIGDFLESKLPILWRIICFTLILLFFFLLAHPTLFVILQSS